MTSDTTTNPPVIEDANTQVTVELLDGKVTTTSIDVARHFGKRHDNVIQAIRNLECSEAFRLLNFKETIQVIPGPKGSKREEPAYRIVQTAHQTEMHLNAIRARQAAGKPFGDPSALHRLANELAELSRLTRELIAHLAKFAQLGAKSHMH